MEIHLGIQTLGAARMIDIIQPGVSTVASVFRSSHSRKAFSVISLWYAKIPSSDFQRNVTLSILTA
jgi:hypothetical protein